MSTTRAELGKITSIKFGHGDYQDAMIGLSVGLGSDKNGWGCGDFKGTWDLSIKVDKHTKWTEKDRDRQFAETMRFVSQLLQQAKKKEVHQLVGVPVQVTFEGNCLKEWRILEEVL